MFPEREDVACTEPEEPKRSEEYGQLKLRQLVRLDVHRYVGTSGEGHVRDERGDETVAHIGRCLQMGRDKGIPGEGRIDMFDEFVSTAKVWVNAKT